MLNIFKLNYQQTKVMQLTSFLFMFSLFWTNFASFSSVSIVDFEQVNICKGMSCKLSFAMSSNYFPLRHLMMIPMSRLANKIKIPLSQANMALMPCLYLKLESLECSHSSLNLISPKICAANPTQPEIDILSLYCHILEVYPALFFPDDLAPFC